MRNPFAGPKVRAHVGVLQRQVLLCTLLGCSASPCAPPPVKVREDPVVPRVAISRAAPAPSAVPAPEPSAAFAATPRFEDPATPGRARIDEGNHDHFIDFPTSISEDGDRIAAMISIDIDFNRFFPEWLVIKDLKTEKIEHEVALLDWDLAANLDIPDRCGRDLAACLPDVQRNVDAANAFLARDRWRPFPCFRTPSQRPSRMGPGCEILSELTFEYKTPNLIVSRGDLRAATMPRPTWSPYFRKPPCERTYIEPFVESVAFDPETGLFVISLSFLGPEANFTCPTPRWDFHPIYMPQFRRKL